ncbi:acetyltransferase [Namhaeicola litoreus]|uniref:Acetyltransferase n=1 Tax=Namhaeicola litoreus TaxID=1052145 RepID=A0ABW3Y2L6_9FLAO
MKDLIIIGAGNVGGFLALNQELFEESYQIRGFLDDAPEKQGEQFWGIPVLGKIDIINEFKDCAIAVGISNPKTKKRILQKIGVDFHFPSFVSKNSWISNRVKIGKGTIIYPNVSVNHETQIDDFVIINMNCAIGHDCRLKNGCALAPGVNLGGFTTVGAYAEIGIGACTIQNIKIGEGAVIGGQTMLLTDVESFSTFIGIPGKKKL